MRFEAGRRLRSAAAAIGGLVARRWLGPAPADVAWRPQLPRITHEVPEAMRGRFLQAGFRGRDFFPHRIRYLPKCGPDGAKLAKRMCDIDGRDASWQVVLHATGPAVEQLPRELFFDRDVVWHQQHFQEAGQVASASLAGLGTTVYTMAHQSDLWQRIARRPEHRTRVQKAFQGWHHLLLNAIAVFAEQQGYAEVRVPTSARMMRFTDRTRAVQPELFERVYDRGVQHHFQAREVDGWWSIRIADNRAAFVRPDRRAGTHAAGRTVCILHDTERGLGHRDIDPGFAARADAESGARLEEMLAVERAAGVRATYAVVGCMLGSVRQAIEGERAPGAHALAFHSFDHADGPQLARCRAVDYRLKGYRAPRSRLTAEHTPADLCWHNFEWFASSGRSLGLDVPTHRDRLAYLPVSMDDFNLHRGTQTYGEWLRDLLGRVHRQDFVTVGLHDCYASHWLPRYRELLDALGASAHLRTMDEVADDLYLAAGV